MVLRSVFIGSVTTPDAGLCIPLLVLIRPELSRSNPPGQHQLPLCHLLVSCIVSARTTNAKHRKQGERNIAKYAFSLIRHHAPIQRTKHCPSISHKSLCVLSSPVKGACAQWVLLHECVLWELLKKPDVCPPTTTLHIHPAERIPSYKAAKTKHTIHTEPPS